MTAGVPACSVLKQRRLCWYPMAACITAMVWAAGDVCTCQPAAPESGQVIVLSATLQIPLLLISGGKDGHKGFSDPEASVTPCVWSE
jgi:hypothetical protein